MNCKEVDRYMKGRTPKVMGVDKAEALTEHLNDCNRCINKHKTPKEKPVQRIGWNTIH